jgi:hypothetical protein
MRACQFPCFILGDSCRASVNVHGCFGYHDLCCVIVDKAPSTASTHVRHEEDSTNVIPLVINVDRRKWHNLLPANRKKPSTTSLQATVIRDILHKNTPFLLFHPKHLTKVIDNAAAQAQALATRVFIFHNVSHTLPMVLKQNKTSHKSQRSSRDCGITTRVV